MTAEKEVSTSIFAFQQNESLSGFIERVGEITEQEFLAKYSDPFLLTSIPTEAELTVWTVLIPVRKKQPKGTPLDKTISRQTKILWDDVNAKLDKVYLGRGPECDIVLAPKSISRKHAMFEKSDGIWYVTDLGSTNGTKLDGHPLPTRMRTVITASPAKLEFGADVALWFVLPEDMWSYVGGFSQRLSDTSKNKLGEDDSAKDKTPTDSPILNRTVAPKSQVRQGPTPEQIARAEAETGELYRADLTTGHDGDDTEERPVRRGSGRLALPIMSQKQSGDPDEKLLAAIRAIAALDSLILTVSVKFRTSDVSMVIYSSHSRGRVTDVADQLVRLGPLMLSVIVTLSIGDGKPVEIYAAE